MATGTVIFWDGRTGWIKRDNVADLPTSQAFDVLLLTEDIVAGTPALHAAASFTVSTSEPWRAEDATIL